MLSFKDVMQMIRPYYTWPKSIRSNLNTLHTVRGSQPADNPKTQQLQQSTPSPLPRTLASHASLTHQLPFLLPLTQMIGLMDRLLKRDNLDLRMTAYAVSAAGAGASTFFCSLRCCPLLVECGFVSSFVFSFFCRCCQQAVTMDWWSLCPPCPCPMC